MIPEMSVYGLEKNSNICSPPDVSGTKGTENGLNVPMETAPRQRAGGMESHRPDLPLQQVCEGADRAWPMGFPYCPCRRRFQSAMLHSA
jgi:hypothetical protein